jgi:hypothetical protein
MPLKDDLAKSGKLSPELRVQVMQIDADTDPDKPLFSAILMLDSETPLSVPGASVAQHGAGNIFTARDMSLNGLKNLVDCGRVKYIEASLPMFPEVPHPKGPELF